MTAEEKIRNDVRAAVRRHRGALTEIATKTGLSREYIRLVLKGLRNNVHVISIASEIVKNRESSRNNMLVSAKRNMEEVATMAEL